jgi:glycosyltransferase involved in cell wall biosynthesis
MIANSQKRLAFFVPSMRGGGAERTTLKLARGVAERGYAVDLLLAQAEGPYLSELPDSVRLIDLKAARVLSSLPALARYLRHERPNAMLSVLNHANIVALWARRMSGAATRIVVSERNTLSYSAQHASNRRGRLAPRLIKRFYPWADGIVAVSKGVADDLAHSASIPRECIRVIYNPIVTRELREKAQAPLDHPWFEPGQPPVVLGAGRLKAQKDFPTLIQSFARVRKRYPSRLMILGTGPERPALEALVAELGLEQDVSLPGFVENPYPYMARSALFVLSSKWEGLPGVLIEALSCGAPVVSTNCPSGPREILGEGQYGQLVPVGDVPAMTRAIELTLAGTVPRPSQASWLPFEDEVVVSEYIDTLLGGDNA